MIQAQSGIGFRSATIAIGVNRSASTLSMELSRKAITKPFRRRSPCGFPAVAGDRAEAIQECAQARRGTPCIELGLQSRTALWNHVQGYLKAGCCPKQSKHTDLVHCKTPSLQVSREITCAVLHGELRTQVLWIKKASLYCEYV
jgi:hypothetical protein